MLRRLLACGLAPLAFALACSSARLSGPEATAPGLTLPAHIAEGSDQGDGTLEPATDGGAPDGDAPKPTGSLPDPAPLALARQWEYRVVYDHGAVHVAGVRALRFARPVVTARHMGRFAIELWIGHELVDRVRFDFPVIAADPPAIGKRHPIHEPPSLAPGAVVDVTVLVPASSRPTRALLVDRATGKSQPLAWPPDAAPPAASAGH